jgi:hypothetical protein
MPAAPSVPTWSDAAAAPAAPKAPARVKAPAAQMIQASAKTTPQPTAKHPAIQRLAQSYVVMSSWTMTETMTESTPESTTGQPSVDPTTAHPGITRMTVLVDRVPERIATQTADQAKALALTPAPKQLQAPSRDQAQQVFPQYAAVPTDLGWVIVEL